MKNNSAGFKKLFIRLMLAIPLGIAINALAFTPSTAEAQPCQVCDQWNRCQAAEFGGYFNGYYWCFDSGDGGWCNTQDDCPNVQDPPAK